MKSIKIYLLPFILLIVFCSPLYSQNDFYNDKTPQKSVIQKASKIDSVLIHGYFTEKDYNELRGIDNSQKKSESEIYYRDEVLTEEEQRKRERDGFFSEVAAEVIVEVVVHTVFILATFWQ